MSSNLRKYVQALYGFDAVVQRVDPGCWQDASPCAGWVARDVVAHSIDVTNGVTKLAGGAASADATSVADDPVAAWADARDRAVSALDSAGALQREADTPFGHMTIDQFIGILYVDPLTHTWDLARATGQQPVLDEGLCADGIAQLTAAGDAIRVEGMFEPPVEPPADADMATRFAAFTGRQV